ncbi:MAG: transcriptional repressor [Chloroflexi bacterium]|nr:transcriptional repressor [Chloroflexota bacterium]
MQQYNDKKFVKSALKVLRSAGHRITRPRRLVLEALGSREAPMSPYDLQKLLQEGDEHLDVVTIYRVLELLQELNLVHKVLSVGGYVRCRLEDGNGCHGYLVCRSCGRLQEFSDESLCRKEDELAARLGFHAEHHLSEFSGLCAGCQV